MGTSKKESIRGDIRIIIIMNIDSKKMNAFDDIDRESLEKIMGLIQID